MWRRVLDMLIVNGVTNCCPMLRSGAFCESKTRGKPGVEFSARVYDEDVTRLK